MVSELLQPASVAPVPRLAFTRQELAASLGISVGTVDAWKAKQGLPFLRRGGVVLFPVDEVRTWLANNLERVSSETC